MYFFLFFYTGAYKAGSVLVKNCSHRFMPSSHLHKAFSVYLYVPVPTLQVSKGSLLIQHIFDCSHVHTKGNKLMWKTLRGKTLAYWKWHLLLVGTSLLHKQIQFVFINNTLIALSWTQQTLICSSLFKDPYKGRKKMAQILGINGSSKEE